MTQKTLIENSIRVHPIFILGVALLLIATGSILGQTIFTFLALETGVDVIFWSLVWVLISLTTIFIGIARSFGNTNA